MYYAVLVNGFVADRGSVRRRTYDSHHLQEPEYDRLAITTIYEVANAIAMTYDSRADVQLVGLGFDGNAYRNPPIQDESYDMCLFCEPRRHDADPIVPLSLDMARLRGLANLPGGLHFLPDGAPYGRRDWRLTSNLVNISVTAVLERFDFSERLTVLDPVPTPNTSCPSLCAHYHEELDKEATNDNPAMCPETEERWLYCESCGWFEHSSRDWQSENHRQAPDGDFYCGDCADEYLTSCDECGDELYSDAAVSVYDEYGDWAEGSFCGYCASRLQEEYNERHNDNDEPEDPPSHVKCAHCGSYNDHRNELTEDYVCDHVVRMLIEHAVPVMLAYPIPTEVEPATVPQPAMSVVG